MEQIFNLRVFGFEDLQFECNIISSINLDFLWPILKFYFILYNLQNGLS